MPHLLFPKSTAQDGRAGDRCQCAPRPPPGQERVSGGNEGKTTATAPMQRAVLGITGMTSTRHSISPVATLTRRVISKADAKDESVVAYAKHPQFGIRKVASAYNARFRSRNTTKQMQASVGSRSTITHLGTCLPAPVSEKNLSSTQDGMFVA